MRLYILGSAIYMVNFVLGKNINGGHKCIGLGGRSIVVVKQWDKQAVRQNSCSSRNF